jgi:hypothetical protein
MFRINIEVLHFLDTSSVDEFHKEKYVPCISVP